MARTLNPITTAIGFTVRFIRLQIQLLYVAWFAIDLRIRDTYYTVLALLLPYRPIGQVIQKGDPGFAGMWPTFAPPTEGDCRSPCPGLNALANHGIINRDGRKIRYKEVSVAMQKAFNLCPSLGDQLTASAYLLDNGRGYFDLSDLNALGIVQHDASYARHDIAFVPDQSVPDADLVDRFVDHATDIKNNRRRLNLGDIAYYNGLRRAECKRSNGEYSLTHSFFHKFFGSGNAAFLYSLFDGDAEDLRVFLKEEKFPDGWEPKVRWAAGNTIFFAQMTTASIEFNTFEQQPLRRGDDYLDQKVVTKKKKTA